MKNQAPIRPAFVFSMVALTGLIIAAAIMISRTPTRSPVPGEVTAAEVAGPTEAAVAEPKAPAPPLRPAEENATRLENARGSGNAARPEIALLQGLPKVQVTRAPDSPLSDLKVSFKLDSRLTQSLYMGDRWTSPPTYLQVGAGEGCTVEASIRGLNAQGKAVNTPATWRAADTGMVKVSRPGPGNTVKLTVLRPGKTTIEIASQGITKQLPLEARAYGPTLMVGLAQ
jgi:hypothetical protein